MSTADLLAAESTLEAVVKEMADECQRDAKTWPREWMLNNASDRAVLIAARRILLDRAERRAANPSNSSINPT